MRSVVLPLEPLVELEEEAGDSWNAARPGAVVKPDCCWELNRSYPCSTYSDLT